MRTQPSQAVKLPIPSSGFPRVIDNTKDTIRDFKKKINTYQNELSADFREKPLINDLKHQIDQLSARLEQAFSKEPELEGSRVEEQNQNDHRMPKGPRNHRIRI